MRIHLRSLSAYLTLVAALALLAAAPSTAAASNGKSAATITFQFDQTQCALTVTSSKDISNYTVDDVKTELSDGTSVLVFPLAPQMVVTVKAGTTVAQWVAPDVLECGVD